MPSSPGSVGLARAHPLTKTQATEPSRQTRSSYGLPYPLGRVDPMGVCDGHVDMSFYLLLGLPSVVMKVYHFGQVGGNDGLVGVLHKFSRVAGAYPPNIYVVKTGDPFDPLCATVPLAPTTCPTKKRRCACSACMGSGHLTSASEN